jgi:hypothetical protein
MSTRYPHNMHAISTPVKSAVPSADLEFGDPAV